MDASQNFPTAQRRARSKDTSTRNVGTGLDILFNKIVADTAVVEYCSQGEGKGATLVLPVLMVG